MSREPEQTYSLVICDRHDEADGVISLTLQNTDGSPLPSWQPGAHIDLLFGNGLERQYSLCSNPADTASYRIAVLQEPAGRGGSEYVHTHLQTGTQVAARGPRNHFELLPAERYLFIAGGIGITPILPMLDAATATGADWTLLYGGRTRSSMAFVQDLTSRHGNRVTIQPQDHHGLLDLKAYLGDPKPGTRIYCCGPGALLDAVENYCQTTAWPAPHIERFQPKPDADPGTNRQFEVELTQTGRTLEIPADASILDVVRAAGVQVLYSCTEGTCGTCETDVLAGVPDHRDSVLTNSERAACDTMMICVSRAKTDRLVLDL